MFAPEDWRESPCRNPSDCRSGLASTVTRSPSCTALYLIPRGFFSLARTRIEPGSPAPDPNAAVEAAHYEAWVVAHGESVVAHGGLAVLVAGACLRSRTTRIETLRVLRGLQVLLQSPFPISSPSPSRVSCSPPVPRPLRVSRWVSCKASKRRSASSTFYLPLRKHVEDFASFFSHYSLLVD